MKNSKRKKRRKIRNKKLKFETLEKKIARKRKEKRAYLLSEQNRKKEFLLSVK